MADPTRDLHQELEVKFCVARLGRLKERVQSSGGALIQPRTLETNLLFDNAGGELTQHHQILRLRQDTATRLTFKGRGIEVDQAHSRPEIEFTASSFEAAKAFLEALGYQVVWIYEKYRTTYDLNGVFTTLDELPFGHFVEVEGPTRDRIQQTSARLGLDWKARILKNYRQLFRTVQEQLEIPPLHLTFAAFANLTVLPEHLGVYPAD